MKVKNLVKMVKKAMEIKINNLVKRVKKVILLNRVRMKLKKL